MSRVISSPELPHKLESTDYQEFYVKFSQKQGQEDIVEGYADYSFWCCLLHNTMTLIDSARCANTFMHA